MSTIPVNSTVTLNDYIKALSTTDSDTSAYIPVSNNSTLKRMQINKITQSLSVASSSANGMMSSQDKARLDSIEFNGFTGQPTANQAPGFGGTFTVQQINQSTTGQISGNSRTVTIPNSLANISNPGLLKALDNNTSHFLRGDGNWSTPPNTTYGVSESTKAGLLSIQQYAELVKLDPYPNPQVSSQDYPRFLVVPPGSGAPFWKHAADSGVYANESHGGLMTSAASIIINNGANPDHRGTVPKISTSTERQWYQVAGGATTASFKEGHLILATTAQHGLMSTADKQNFTKHITTFHNLVLNSNTTSTIPMPASVLSNPTNTYPHGSTQQRIHEDGSWIFTGLIRAGGAIHFDRPDNNGTTNRLMAGHGVIYSKSGVHPFDYSYYYGGSSVSTENVVNVQYTNPEDSVWSGSARFKIFASQGKLCLDNETSGSVYVRLEGSDMHFHLKGLNSTYADAQLRISNAF